MRFKKTGITQNYKNGLLVKHHKFPKMPNPDSILDETMVDEYFWKAGDRFSLLAFKYYGDVNLWWVIAWFNKTPMENMLNPGDIIVIPRNVVYIVSLF